MAEIWEAKQSIPRNPTRHHPRHRRTNQRTTCVDALKNRTPKKKPRNLHRTLGEQGKNGGKERRCVQGGGWVGAEGAPDEKETKELNQLGTPSSEPKRSNFTEGTIKVVRMKLESASSNIAYEVRQII